MNATEITPLEPGELHLGGPAWRAAEAAGHDMSLIIAMLRLPVSERLRLHDLALNAVLNLRDAKIQQDGVCTGSGATVDYEDLGFVVHESDAAILEARQKPV